MLTSLNFHTLIFPTKSKFIEFGKKNTRNFRG
jgi:hypothetical protein